MKIKLASIMVDDQEKALKFYTEKLGFQVKIDMPIGDARWITLVSPEDPDGTEIPLEPDANPMLEGAAIEFKRALKEKGIPYTAYETDDIQRDYNLFKERGVEFISEPQQTGPVTQTVFDDTCGNLIMIYQQ